MISLVPRNLNELSQMLSEAPEHTKVLAGGTDLVIQMMEGKCRADALLYIGRVPELHEIAVNSRSALIGSAVTMAELAACRSFPPCMRALQEAAGDVGSPQVRNRATIGGNIANAAPAGDMAGVLCLLDAQVVIYQADGSVTRMPVRDFILGPGRTAIGPGQIIYGFEIPLSRTVTHFRKLGSRKKVTISRINLQMGLAADDGGVITSCDIWASAIAPKPVHFPETSQRLIGYNVNDPQLASVISEDVSAFILSQGRSSGAYKSKAVKGVTEDVVNMFRSTSIQSVT